MPRRYTEEEALKLALDFFQGDELRASVFLNRYALRDHEGRLLEATPEEMWRRLVRGATRAEKGASKRHDPLPHRHQALPPLPRGAPGPQEGPGG